MILYSKEINERLKDATERTLYKPLGNFLESFTNLIAETFTYSLFIATLEHFKSGKQDELTLARKADIYKEGKLYLNEKTYISGVNEEVFEFMIGGYQVLDKWLSDRKKTMLSLDELMHYLKIIVSLKETIRVMSEIDEVVNISK